MGRKTELERIFQECQDAHNYVVKLHRISSPLGIFAVTLTFAMGAIHATRGNFLISFLQFFLCLFNLSLVCYNCKSMKKHNEEWAKFEARHDLLMMLLDEDQT